MQDASAIQLLFVLFYIFKIKYFVDYNLIKRRIIIYNLLYYLCYTWFDKKDKQVSCNN